MKTLQSNAGNEDAANRRAQQKTKMASADLSETTISLFNNECKKAATPQISRKIARCRAHMTLIRNKMDGNVRTLKAHPANDAAASELKQHVDDINAQYWRASYIMEIYISMLEEEARQEEREPDLRSVGERDEGMARRIRTSMHNCPTVLSQTPEHVRHPERVVYRQHPTA